MAEDSDSLLAGSQSSQKRMRATPESPGDGDGGQLGDEMDEDALRAHHRKIRLGIRGVGEELNASGAVLASGGLEQVKRTIALNRQEDDLFKKVDKSRTREAFHDAHNKARLGRIAVEQAMAVDVALSSDNPMEFGAKLKQWMERQDGNAQPNDDDARDGDQHKPWQLLGALMAKHFAVAPGPSFMSGAIPTVPVVRQPRAPRQKDAVTGPSKEVKDLQEVNDPDKVNATTLAQVAQLNDQLESVGPYPVWRLVADPKSMAQTVEHMFHLSYLVKEQRARVFPGADGPMAKTAEPPKEAGQADRVQGVVRVDWATLRQAVDKYNIQDSLIKHREVVARVPQAQKAPQAKAASRKRTTSPNDDDDDDDDDDDHNDDDNDDDVDAVASQPARSPAKRAAPMSVGPTQRSGATESPAVDPTQIVASVDFATPLRTQNARERAAARKR